VSGYINGSVFDRYSYGWYCTEPTVWAVDGTSAIG